MRATSVGGIAEPDDAVKGVLATQVCYTLATFFGGQSAVDKTEAYINWIEGTIRIGNVGHDAGAAFRRGHLMVEEFASKRLRLGQVFLIGAINVDGRG